MVIDLNSDLGESFGHYKLGNDDEIMKHITSANIACGGHAGDPSVIEKTILMAIENKVAIGAHPSYPDVAGFGRRSMKIKPEDLYALTLYQVGALKAMAEALGGKLDHVKPHGALYSDLTTDYNRALAFVNAIKKLDSELIVVGLANSKLLKAAREVGLKGAAEIFADRAYNDDGSLVSRLEKGAVLTDWEVCFKQMEQFISSGTIQSKNGNTLEIYADTICVHGDNENAVEFVKELKKLLSAKNIHTRCLKCNI